MDPKTGGEAATCSSSGEAAPQFDVIFVIGGPGAGKRTLCERLAARFGFYHHFSAGDYLRSLAKAADSTNADWVSPASPLSPAEVYAGLMPADLCVQMKRSALLPDDVILKMLLFEMQQVHAEQGCLGFIIDGFPRTVQSAMAWHVEVGKPAMVLRVHTLRDTAQKRFLTRGRDLGDTAEEHDIRHDQFEIQNPAIEMLYMGLGLLRRIDNEGELDKTVSQAMKALVGVQEVVDRPVGNN
ncbi:P-loop containing nucleoside triphosphate hydrolase protein [Microdochium bolleyi]|uniref:p-loop containing nucleoside triphosphate hydrolase protein n=1 Tax=Microdochium bolleyi TaxID=196109 RepID=A0A136IPL8_9PEZI|nr:P-loop containing nucleoside triphosphate hydrolase protein [Microdochium bolleyi]